MPLTNFVYLVVPVIRDPVQKYHDCIHWGRPGGGYLHHKPQCPGKNNFIIIHWGSEIHTCLDFEWSKGLGQLWSCPSFQCYAPQIPKICTTDA